MPIRIQCILLQFPPRSLIGGSHNERGDGCHADANVNSIRRRTIREIRSPSAFCTAARHLDMASLISFGSCCCLSFSPPIPPKTLSRSRVDDGDDVDAGVQKAWDDGEAAASRSVVHAHPRLRDGGATLGLFRFSPSVMVFDCGNVDDGQTDVWGNKRHEKIIDVTSVGNKTQNVSPFSLGVAKIENVFFERCCFWRASDRQMLY